MERPWDEGSIARVLRGAIERGKFTLEDLDHPAWVRKELRPDRRTFLTVMRRSAATSCEAIQPLTAARRAPQDRPNIYPDPIRIEFQHPLMDIREFQDQLENLRAEIQKERAEIRNEYRLEQRSGFIQIMELECFSASLIREAGLSKARAEELRAEAKTTVMRAVLEVNMRNQENGNAA